MIRGYPGQPSLAPGEPLVLHVATDAPRFRVCVYRWGDGFVPVWQSDWQPGASASPEGPASDWHWPAYRFDLPHDWPSAVYVAHLQEPEAVAFQGLCEPASALFVVRGRGRAGLLYKIPLATYHAYNCTGGGCFYVDPVRSVEPPGSKVSLRRPGGGIGGDTWGALDHYDLGSPRQTFAHWDALFIQWLLRRGYQPEFCCDLDLHHDARLCDRYRLMVSVGHDEYWSEPTRDHVEAYVARGGNVAFFGANLCWWRVHLVDDGGALVCHQGGPRGALDHWWSNTGAGRPEDSLTGVSYRHGGGWWDGPRHGDGYRVQQPDHWVFEGTQLRRGERFGHDTAPPLVGYECDGAPLSHIDPETGVAVLAEDAHRTGTPPGFQLLAAAPLGPEWQELPPREGLAAREGVHAATMGVFSPGGTVFTVGTTDWAQVLASGQDARVERITRNVLDQLLADTEAPARRLAARP
ncbi:N,N-dimethylformamidase beta subunit family domain-containing protein [Caldimonas brevitalea]|uniref:N,N-dimethylformamidase beta subunit-like C-terminal domain-containing protein n=1 Tax=Caldimonas brevitalea TaxID=413882 RepID=A0A0G3BH99_9BURK|nr:N,N-dimethylformamidase beta subunit family domain-containing protein [Caldimonas brevitalea]AKJ27343.1 hypothetical protein AAW51_0652 [Caldimonas brevitalea]